jgi:anti-sigma factor RsiW
MAHLGADVAAYVDGQLSESAMQAAAEHLVSCDDCAKAVRQQALVKSRMSTVATPDPPPALLASLAGLASSAPVRESWWERVFRSVPFRAGVVLVGASVAVLVAAYAVGSPDGATGDKITPPYDRYAADFYGLTTVEASNTISTARMSRLDGSGWPCLAILAGDLERISGSFVDHNETVALSYSNARARLNLYEQVGVLDHDGLNGFKAVKMGSSLVWVRDGLPMLVTWDDDGVVYTMATNADRGRVARAVAELPRGTYREGPVGRIGDGLSTMTSWVHAA